MWGLFRAKNTGMAPLVTWGTGSDRSEIRMPCCPRLVDATWRRTNLRSSLPSSIAPQSWLFVLFFARFALQLQKAISFQRSADLGEFYVKSKGFPCSTWKLSDFGRMDEKRGGLSSSCGAFSGLKIQEWHCSEHGVRGSDRSEIRMPCCPRSVDATWGRTKLPFQVSTSSIAPAKLAVCAVFVVLPSNFKRPYLFNRLADLGEFYVKSKGFPCSTWKLSDFGRMDEKEGAFLPHVGPFQG